MWAHYHNIQNPALRLDAIEWNKISDVIGGMLHNPLVSLDDLRGRWHPLPDASGISVNCVSICHNCLWGVLGLQAHHSTVTVSSSSF